MKKYLKIFIILILTFCAEVFALDNVEATDIGDYLQDNKGNVYPIYEKKINDKFVYALNPDASFNFDLKTYYEISLDESPFARYAEDFNYLSQIILENNSYLYHSSIVEELLWEEMYHQDYTGLLANDEYYLSKREKFRNAYYTLKDGLDIIDTTVFTYINRENAYYNDSLKYYEVLSVPDHVSLNKYDAFMLMSINDPGKYEVKLRLKSNSDYLHLYTDGSNYLLSPGVLDNLEYSFSISSLEKYYEIYAIDENLKPVSNRCYNFYNVDNFDGYLDSGCTDERGILSIYFNEDIENIIVESSDSDEYNTFKIAVKLNDYKTKTTEYVIKKEIKEKETELQSKVVNIYVWDENKNRIENRCYDFYINGDFENVYTNLCSNALGGVSLLLESDVISLAVKAISTPDIYENSNFFINLNLNASNIINEYLVLKKNFDDELNDEKNITDLNDLTNEEIQEQQEEIFNNEVDVKKGNDDEEISDNIRINVNEKDVTVKEEIQKNNEENNLLKTSTINQTCQEKNIVNNENKIFAEESKENTNSFIPNNSEEKENDLDIVSLNSEVQKNDVVINKEKENKSIKLKHLIYIISMLIVIILLSIFLILR